MSLIFGDVFGVFIKKTVFYCQKNEKQEKFFLKRAKKA